jgi:hypothetical protein
MTDASAETFPALARVVGELPLLRFGWQAHTKQPQPSGGRRLLLDLKGRMNVRGSSKQP